MPCPDPPGGKRGGAGGPGRPPAGGGGAARAADHAGPGLARAPARRKPRPADLPADEVGADIGRPDDCEDPQHRSRPDFSWLRQPQQQYTGNCDPQQTQGEPARLGIAVMSGDREDNRGSDDRDCYPIPAPARAAATAAATAARIRTMPDTPTEPPRPSRGPSQAMTAAAT